MQYAAFSQDECLSSAFIGNIEDYCSGLDEFTTRTATASPEPRPGCWLNNANTNDIWVSFRSSQLAIEVKIFGRNDINNPQGLELPSLAIYEGPCSQLREVDCLTSGRNSNELLLSDLTIGQTYYLRIDGEGDPGNFQLCINAFSPTPLPESDCGAAVVLCDKSPFSIESLTGHGQFSDEADDSCLDTFNGSDDGNSENRSAWYTWQCKESGTLTFDLIPNNTINPEEDLDFALYQLPNGVQDCSDKILLRCMASGETIGASGNQNAPCFGATGLSTTANDDVEERGCSNGDDNYVRALDMIAGESYALIVNNFTPSGFGFNIAFGGTGTFEGPQPIFDVISLGDIFECDRSLMVIDESISSADDIVSWSWNFGVGAIPQRSSEAGDQTVMYDSFGEKSVALTVETARGCLVTEVIDLFIEPCCADESLDVIPAGVNIVCAGEESGSINAAGQDGNPPYEYSLDGVNFTPNPIFMDLEAGPYDVFIQDRKGCVSESEIILEEPEPIIVDAGPDQSVQLGCETTLDGLINPENGDYTFSWIPNENLSCIECLNPTVLPLGSTVFQLILTDPNGCEVRDSVFIATDNTRPIYAPNAIQFGGSSINSYFKLYGGKGGEIIEELFIYDRWGGLMYEGRNLSLNDDPNEGWNGIVNGDRVAPGTYPWIAKVRFIDNVVLEFVGDVTVFQ